MPKLECNWSRIARQPDLESRLSGGWKTGLTVVVSFAIGLGALLFFVSPQEILEALSRLDAASVGLGLLPFLVGCWAASLRWWNCLEKDVSFRLAADTFGVAQAGNLFLPGRVGEPLRVFLLSKSGSSGPKATSALLQERINEQILRFGFLALVLTLGAGNEEELWSKAAWTGGIAVVVIAFLALSVKYSAGVSSGVGSVCNRLPYLSRLDVESLLSRTLTDLGRTAWSPSGRKALAWGLVAWGAYALHTGVLIRLFVESDVWILALLVVGLSPPTGATQPGLYHGVVAGALYLFNVPKLEALGIAVVLHAYQTVLFALWGGLGWVRVAALIRGGDRGSGGTG